LLLDIPVCLLDYTNLSASLLLMARMREAELRTRRETDARGGARERILEAAYGLFSTQGIQAVGVDTIVAESQVAKMTLYRYFPSKLDLVVAFLDLRHQRWTHEWLEAEIERLATTPRERLLAIFDLFDEWFRRGDYEGCSFISTLLEIVDKHSPIHAAAVRHLDSIRAILELHAEQAGATDPEATAYELQILMMGAIVSASRGDLDAARRARGVAEMLLELP
jgi:AcrR family transcriptional regulator